MTERLGVARALLRLYPRAWRERYGEEVLALVEQSEFGLFTAVDLVWGAVAEQWQAFLAGEGTRSARSFRGVLFVLTLLLLSGGIASGLTAAGIPLPDRRILGLTQYLGVAALGRALLGSRIRLLALGPTEIAGWMTAALLSAVILQLSWTPHAYWTWMLGEVHTGRGAAFNAIFGTYLVVISMPAASRAPRERPARMVQP